MCVYLCVCWLPACPRSYLFSDVRRQFCLCLTVYVWFSSSTCKPSAHTPSLAVVHARIQAVRPLQCYHPKRQTASPWFNKLPRESHRGGEALSADNCPPCEPSFFFSSDSPAKRRLSFSLFFCVIVNVASRSDPLPAAAHVSVGCVRPVLTLSVSDRLQRRSHTWQRQAWAQCWGAYAQGFSVSAPHPPNTHITANPAKPQKAMGQTTDRFPIYHCVPRFTQAIQLYQHRTATLTAILREKRSYKDATTSKKKTNTKFCRAPTALYFDSFCYFVGCDGFVAVFEQSSGDLWVE